MYRSPRVTGLTADDDAPAITLGLLVYNGEPFLEKSIESLLAQSFDDFELVISDNASTDSTEEICRSYADADQRVRYIRQHDNIGALENFNFLVAQARGRYFKWVAADDLIAPDFLARCFDVLEAHPQYVLCHSLTVTIGSSGEELPNDIIQSSGAAERDGELEFHPYRPSRRFHDVLLGNTSLMDLWGLMRTDALRNTGLLKPFVGYEKVLMATLSLYGRFWEIPERLFAYRVHTASLSSQTTAAARQRRCAPRSRTKAYPRIQYLRGYVSGIAHSDLGLLEKVICFLVIGRYLFQVTKWLNVLRSSLFGDDFGAGNAEILRQNSARANRCDFDQGKPGWII